MLINEHVYDVGMLMQAWEADLEDVPEFTLFNKFDEEPKSQSVGAMHKKLPHQKIHTLDIICLIVIT
jgi:hypothetical protein